MKLLSTVRSIPLALLALLFSHLAAAQWYPANGPLCGAVTSFAQNESFLFAGTQSGVFRTTNNGVSWEAIDSLLTRGIVGAVAVSGPYLLAGVYGGVCRTSNSGYIWEPANKGLSLTSGTVTAFLVRDSDVFAGVSGMYGGPAVYRSTDHGASWTAASTGLPQASQIHSLGRIGRHLFAGTDGIYSGTSAGIYHSSNNGVTWSLLKSTGISTGNDDAVNAFAALGDDLYAASFNSGIYRSTDSGATWKRTNLHAGPVYSLAFSGSTLLAGLWGGTIAQTSDGGVNWGISSIGSAYVYALVTNGIDVFAGTDYGGVYHSIDTGKTWMGASISLIGTAPHALVNAGKDLFAGVFSGVYRSTNNGVNWTAARNGLYNTQIYSLAVSDSTVLAGTDSGVLRSTDYGASWNDASRGLPHTAVIALAIYGNYVFAGGYFGMARSSDNGAHWSALTNGLQNTYELAFANNGPKFFAGGYGGVFLSTDSGANWTGGSVGFPQYLPVISLAINGADVFAGTQSYSDSSGVYRSTDDGKTWNLGYSFVYNQIQALAVSDHNLFAGTHKYIYGVFRSVDAGKTWTNISNGLDEGESESINALLVHGGKLFAATDKVGVWGRTLSEIIVKQRVEEVPQRSNSIQVYPNPLSGSAQISITPEASGYAEIAIVNTLGQEITRVYSGMLDASEHRFTWEAQAKACATGVYECVVRMNGRTQTLPIVVE